MILNLGCGNPANSSWRPLPGAENLDKRTGWQVENGLPYPDGSVSGITISHLIMYFPLSRWVPFFLECARVLEPGGIIRVTEDDTMNPMSSTFGGWQGSEPAVSPTCALLVKDAFEQAGITPLEATARTTNYRDESLIQAWHGYPPNVFFIEGRR